MFKETAVSLLSVTVNTGVRIFRAHGSSTYSYLVALKTIQWRV